MRLMTDDQKEMITLTIDGRPATVAKGTTVLEAAKSIGIDIPYFCWHPKLESIGACRMCLVDIEKMPRPVVSCATEAVSGMVVHTDSERIIKARKGVLEFLLLNHPLDCPTCDKGGECDLQDITFRHGNDWSRQTFTRKRVVDEQTTTTFDDKHIGPEIIRNMNRCVTCFKCVRFNKEIAGEYDLGAYRRTNLTVIDTPPGEQIDNLYSGNVVEICPVGALTNTDWRYKVRCWVAKKTASICSHDADGQNLTLWYDYRGIHRTTSRKNDDVDEGWLCDIARYGYQYVNSPNRLKMPLIKRGGKQIASSWDEALALIARRFKEIKEKKGSVCIAGLAGGNLSTETYYLFNKFFRMVLRSNSVDYRLEYIGLKDGPGTEVYDCLYTAPFVIAELEKADAVLVFGSNLIKDHPMVNLRLRKAHRHNHTKVYTANPVETKSADISCDEMIYRPETEIAFLAGIIHAVIDQKLYKNLDEAKALEIKSLLHPGGLAEAASLCGIEEKRFMVLAQTIAAAQNLFILAGDLMKSSRHRYEIANGLYNLANLLGVAEGHAAILPSYANSTGAERVGLRPVLPSDMIKRLEDKWGTTLPDSEGCNTSRIFRGALDEEIDSVFIMGANPAMRYPDGNFINDALDKLDFLVVADLFETATTAKADVVLPLAAWSEQEGLYLNLEGRQQRFNKALPPPRGIKTGVEILCQLAEKMETPLELNCEQLKNEAADIVRMWARLPRLTGKFFAVKHPALNEHKEFPYYLLLGNDLHHFGYLTEYCPSLMRFTPEPYLELSPALADKLGIESGMSVRVESPSGKVILKAKISEFFEGEVVFIPNNFSAVAGNNLISRDGGSWVTLEKLDGN